MPDTEIYSYKDKANLAATILNNFWYLEGIQEITQCGALPKTITHPKEIEIYKYRIPYKDRCSAVLSIWYIYVNYLKT
jgi:hypothetical protein